MFPLLAGGTKEIVTASMDKSMALWRLQVIIRVFYSYCYSFFQLYCFAQIVKACIWQRSNW